jgi:hypothetical protein
MKTAILTVILLVFAGHDQRPTVQMPWRMHDWATCVDGKQVYSRNPQYPLEAPAEEPCAEHGGVRAFGPGLRLNEKAR